MNFQLLYELYFLNIAVSLCFAKVKILQLFVKIKINDHIIVHACFR